MRRCDRHRSVVLQNWAGSAAVVAWAVTTSVHARNAAAFMRLAMVRLMLLRAAKAESISQTSRNIHPRLPDGDRATLMPGQRVQVNGQVGRGGFRGRRCAIRRTCAGA